MKRQKGKGRRRAKSPRKKLSRVLAFASVVAVVCGVLLALNMMRPRPEPSAQPRAAIVDALLHYPNPEFVEEATGILSSAGFEVDYIGTEEVTVGLYRRLPSLGYDLLILRVHCGPLVWRMPNGTRVATENAVLFTAEAYDPNQYPLEQTRNQLAKAKIIGRPEEEYFAIPPWFVDQCMEGEFKDTLIILDSCYGFYSPSMAGALIRRGAAVFIGWEGEVTADHTDRAVLTLLKALCVEGLTVKRAVEEAMLKVGPDPYSDSILLFYPFDRGDYALGVQGTRPTTLKNKLKQASKAVDHPSLLDNFIG